MLAGSLWKKAVDLADVGAVQRARGHGGRGGREPGREWFAGDRGAGGGVFGVADAAVGFGCGDAGDAGQGAGQAVAEFGGGGFALQSGDQLVLDAGQLAVGGGDRRQGGQSLTGVQGVQPRPGQGGDRCLQSRQRVVETLDLTLV